MAKLDRELNRLLAGAARAAGEPAPEIPFGFDTRVVAFAREKWAADRVEARIVTHLLRRVVVFGLLLTAVSASAAYWQISENDDLAEPLSNSYAIADTAIDAEFFQ